MALYDGPTFSQPFRNELNDDEIEENLEFFYNEIGDYFADIEVEIERYEDDSIGITINISEDECDDIVKLCLNKYDLYANKL